MSGSDAALLVHDDSIVDGDTFTPLFAFHSGEIAVPDPMMGAVESITLGKILEFLGKRIKVKQRKISLYEISNCADAIAVGTGMGIRRIASIDDITIPTDLEAGLEYILCEAEDMGFMEGHADAEWEH